MDSIYTFTRPELPGPLPLLMFAAGGGFIERDQIKINVLSGLIAARLKCVVVSIEYRLATQHTFPTAHNDCLFGYLYCLSHAIELGAHPEWIGLIGESAGGTLIAGLTLIAKQKKIRQPIFQCLAYPMLNGAMETPSRLKYSEGAADAIRGFHAYAGTPEAYRSALLVPLGAQDLGGLPRTHIITAEHDPLRDEGEAYAARLTKSGVKVSSVRYDTGHGFLTSIKGKSRAIRDVAIARIGQEFDAALSDLPRKIEG